MAAPTIAFLGAPNRASSWTSEQGETQLFALTLPILAPTTVMLDTTIAAWIQTSDRSFYSYDAPTFNTYLLYVNGIVVSHAGYESDEANVFAPNLETSMMTWTGVVAPPLLVVNVTAELPAIPVNATSTVDPADPDNPFGDALGAYFRYALFS